MRFLTPTQAVPTIVYPNVDDEMMQSAHGGNERFVLVECVYSTQAFRSLSKYFVTLNLTLLDFVAFFRSSSADSIQSGG